MQLKSLFFAAAAAPLAAAQMGPCSFDSGVGATFDASALMNGTYDYQLMDITDIYTLNQTFFFNFCQNIVAPTMLPPACQAKPAAPAYRFDMTDGSCLRLGYDQNKRPLVQQMSLIDTNNPAEGWMVTYPNGDACLPTVNAAMSVVMRCGRGQFPPAGVNPLTLNITSFIDESNTCQFSAFSWSPYGCPLECPFVGGRICGGNGVCGYDNSANTARCFCYDNWIENDCQTPRYTAPSGAIAGAVIGGVALGAVVVLAYALWAGRGAAGAGTGQVDAFYGKM